MKQPDDFQLTVTVSPRKTRVDVTLQFVLLNERGVARRYSKITRSGEDLGSALSELHADCTAEAAVDASSPEAQMLQVLDAMQINGDAESRHAP